MPCYAFPFTIPSNTAKSSPRRWFFKVDAGLIVKADFHFPSGCVGLAGCRVKHAGEQIYPVNPDGWIVTDNESVVFYDVYDLTLRVHSELMFEGYNVDEVEEHTVTARFSILPAWVARFYHGVGL